MQYNLIIKTQMSTYNILDINDDELNIIIDAYKHGRESFFLNGKKYWLNNLSEIQIFTFEHPQIKTGNDLFNQCKQQGLLSNGYFSHDFISVEILGQCGTKKTNDFIKGDFGYLKDNRIEDKGTDVFVDLTRIEELSLIKDSSFDFTKLISLLKELNVAYANNLFLTIPALVRAIIDHIPPLFGKTNFAEVCGGHGTRSFKDNMNNLDKSCRKIADSFLHGQIRNKESLPTRTQIDFRADLDVLLQEIVRIKK